MAQQANMIRPQVVSNSRTSLNHIQKADSSSEHMIESLFATFHLIHSLSNSLLLWSAEELKLQATFYDSLQATINWARPIQSPKSRPSICT